MNTEKILIIEDEELIREELKTLLSNAGYVVDCVVDFGETLNYIKLTSPDLILLDVNLPGQDGYRLCTSIRTILYGTWYIYSDLVGNGFNLM